LNSQRSTYQPGPEGLPIKRQWAILGGVILIGLVLVVGGPLLARKPASEPPPAPAGTYRATDEQWAGLGFQQVGLAQVQPHLDTDGQIATDDDLTTQVFSPYSGRVTQILVKAGDRVKAGQPLFRVQSAELAQGRGDLAAAEAQTKLAEANEARMHALYQTAGGALKDWRQSQADLAVAQATLQAVRDRLKVMGRTDAEIVATDRAGGQVGAVASPISGVVTQRLIGVGQTLGSVTNGGANPAMVVSDLSRVWLTANVREADSARVRLGEPLRVAVPALPGRVFTAKVDYVAPAIDPATHRLAVRAVVDNPDGLLKPQMFASFDLATGPGRSAVTAPEQAVIFEGDTARVWVARPADKTLELRQIKAGQVSDGQVEVLSGLNPGEWIVTSGSLFIDRAAKPD
jgi:cobalt-zinc-cadmium efflux system membrane fusion protein